LSRHGSRYPTGDGFKTILNLVNVLKSLPITNSSFDWIKTYNISNDGNSPGYLAPKGEQEIYGISKRLMAKYAQFFSNYIPPELLPILTTNVHRASRSGNTFGYGIYETEGSVGSNFNPLFTYTNGILDLELRFFENCNKYNATQIENDVDSQFSTCFSAIYVSVAKNIATKLGIPSYFDRLVPYAGTFQDACSFDITLLDTESYFCSLLGPSDALALEYVDDIQTYYVSGYGTPLAYQISAPLLASFFAKFDSYIKSPQTSQKGLLRFAHAETLMPFTAILGLNEDPTPLVCDASGDPNRKWKTSQISPFSGNIAMLLYNCSDGYKVKLVQNEVESYFPPCGDTLYCPLATLKEFYQSSINLANNWNQLCN
jgi:multiple inositol-polyphosphate phosphatase/2,3-bisphosphoglycerate 3-phosphatase